MISFNIYDTFRLNFVKIQDRPARYKLQHHYSKGFANLEGHINLIYSRRSLSMKRKLSQGKCKHRFLGQNIHVQFLSVIK